MEEEQCPVCGNEKLISWTTQEFTRYYSHTGKCIKVDKSGAVIMWGYICKCGWNSETYSE